MFEADNTEEKGALGGVCEELWEFLFLTVGVFTLNCGSFYPKSIGKKGQKGVKRVSFFRREKVKWLTDRQIQTALKWRYFRARFRENNIRDSRGGIKKHTVSKSVCFAYSMQFVALLFDSHRHYDVFCWTVATKGLC